MKEAVLPFDRFPDVDSLLGPEMRSTGEVMGIDRTFGLAFAKSQIAAGNRLPSDGAVFMSLADRDKEGGVSAARVLSERSASRSWQPPGPPPSWKLAASPSRPLSPRSARQPARATSMLSSCISSGKVRLVVNTPRGRGPRADGAYIRQSASANRVPCLTTVAAARAAAAGIADWGRLTLEVRSLQEFHEEP